jgi:hypothetical protein
MNADWDQHDRESRENASRRAVARRDRQAVRLGALIDASYKLARRIEIESSTHVGPRSAHNFAVADKMREAALNARGTVVMLEAARDKFSGKGRL